MKNDYRRQRNGWSLVINCVVAFVLPISCYGAVIFEDNFDSHADWNVNNIHTDECAGACKTAPVRWTNHRTVPGNSALPNPTGSIRKLPGNLPDHTSGKGKAYIAFNQSVDGANWPGDSILMKVFPLQYQELYVRFWARTQSNWRTVAGAQSKIFRVFHWHGTDNIFQFAKNSAPIFFWDWGANNRNAASYITAYRCDPQSSNYYCTASGIPSYQKTDFFYPFEHSSATSKGAYADTQWHRYDFHVKMNNIGSNNGILEWWYDGKRIERRTSVQWKAPAGSSADNGWNVIAIGGNSNNTFAPLGEQWYAIDDLVVSTTPIPEDYSIPNR